MIFIYQKRKQRFREVTKLRMLPICTQMVSGKAEINPWLPTPCSIMVTVLCFCVTEEYFKNGILAARRRSKQILKTILLEMEVWTT